MQKDFFIEIILFHAPSLLGRGGGWLSTTFEHFYCTRTVRQFLFLIDLYKISYLNGIYYYKRKQLSKILHMILMNLIESTNKIFYLWQFSDFTQHFKYKKWRIKANNLNHINIWPLTLLWGLEYDSGSIGKDSKHISPKVARCPTMLHKSRTVTVSDPNSSY